MRYGIEIETVGGWEPSGHDENGERVTFATREEAQADIDELVADTVEAYFAGQLDSSYRADEFRIVEVQA